MAFDFDRLFPEAAKKRRDEKGDYLLYIILVEWGWDYNTMLNTPIPVIFRTLTTWSKIKKEQNKK